MKRSKPLQQKTALQPGSKGLARTGFKRKQPAPGSTLQMVRQAKPMRSRSKSNARPRPATGEAQLCRGQSCYLQVPGVPAHPIETVVPCHSNQARHGKGRGIKAHDRYTVPGCMYCHYNLDQGRDLDKDQRHEIWDRAYEKWSKYRMEKYGI